MLQRLKTFSCDQREMYGLFATADWLVVGMAQPAECVMINKRPNGEAFIALSRRQSMITEMFPSNFLSRVMPFHSSNNPHYSHKTLFFHAHILLSPQKHFPYDLSNTFAYFLVCVSVLITCSRPHPQCSTFATSKEALLSQLSIPAIILSKKQPTPNSSASLGRAHTDAAMTAHRGGR
ncbi:uncharacterized protein MONOS_13942 [Monocercomonoides exilis]|uniref:uncharacterized protein n=1 Tax=Monocercomonoides exilis TaxID=2049356 RepID=UPI00355ABC95|nr:hypothetical protein MONOS_13942 [Monocercomonoides exilis]|eukprot:MONOS_13942.1-p1 / transcript=MONOS_13942.1 / gene=MONOS_13942 / organism=Monocercomonoides_exilis_PA203 / gene_product=unspecified product / transcript_product=unspecified product / location=Mono_scaffold00908:7552-8085(-) / protein_length=178 / sequence_SO=supercontig / SO=protein_coding / is_pseudo=false